MPRVHVRLEVERRGWVGVRDFAATRSTRFTKLWADKGFQKRSNTMARSIFHTVEMASPCEAAEFAGDAPVAPGRALGLEVRHELAELGRGAQAS